MSQTAFMDLMAAVTQLQLAIAKHTVAKTPSLTIVFDQPNALRDLRLAVLSDPQVLRSAVLADAGDGRWDSFELAGVKFKFAR